MPNLIPILVRDMMRPLRMMENQLRMAEEEIFRPHRTGLYRNRPGYFLQHPEQDSDEAVIQDKEKFQVKLDVTNFKPEEIKVKTIDGNAIEIEGKHEEKQDEHGWIARHFVRRYVLPKGHDLKSVVTKLSEDGVLTITAPKVQGAEKLEEPKTIPVEHITSGKEGEGKQG